MRYPEGLIIQEKRYYIEDNERLLCKPIDGNGNTYRLWFSVFTDLGMVTEVPTEEMEILEIEVDRNALLLSLHINSEKPKVVCNMNELYNSFINANEISLNYNFIMDSETGIAIELFAKTYAI